MLSAIIPKEKVLEVLQELEPERWSEVLDFIGYLKYQTKKASTDLRHNLAILDALIAETAVGLDVPLATFNENIMELSLV